MKKKIFITIGICSLAFLLGGIYIIATIESSTSTLSNLIRLYQIESQRQELLIELNSLQSDLQLRDTPHAKTADAIVANVLSTESMVQSCFDCHHSVYIIKRLNDLGTGIDEYKKTISRLLTMRANNARVMAEEEIAFKTAKSLLDEVNTMVHMAAARLSQKTDSSINDILNAKMALFMVVGLTPFLAAIFGYVFIRGLTRPLKVLLGATRKVTGGKLDYRVEGLSDEFGEVAASFNDMTSRVEKYTKSLEIKTLDLEHAHQEMSTFCHILKQIGIQQTLDGVGSFLMKELENILKSPNVVLYVFSSDRNTLFALSVRETKEFTDPDIILNTSAILEEIEGVAISPTKSFAPPLLPPGFPVDGRQIIIPLRIQTYIDGAFVAVYPPDCKFEKVQLDLVALILEQASGTIKRAVFQEEKIRALEGRIGNMSEYCGLIGKDPKMHTIYNLIEDIAHTDATVLIQGETGTGKEMVARAIYSKSQRMDKPFVVINCSAYPATLLESELFGHEKGSFTGAIRQKIGRFEQADGGTVFLDEIGEIPFSSQIKLLRVLQTQKFERLGGEQTVSVNVRILAATNRDLITEVKNGNFREDLFYRINVIPVQLPPLRDRRNDIPLLARYFQQKFTAKNKSEAMGFSSSAMRFLLDYHWPGNVRELENTVEHAVVLSKGERIEVSHLPAVFQQNQVHFVQSETKSRKTIKENEKRLLMDVLEECNWNKSQAAIRLGIGRSTLYDKLSKYNLIKTDSSKNQQGVKKRIRSSG